MRSRARTLFVAVRVGLGAAVLAAPVRAAGPPAGTANDGRAPTDTRALALFEQSARAYREGRFKDAVDLLLEARRLKAEPVLLYDLGRAYEALGRPADAADAYARYLEEDANAPDRRAIEGRVATLRAEAAELEAARQRPEPPPPPPARREAPPPSPPPPPKSDGLDAVPWIVAGAGVAALGTGIVLGNVARARHDDAVGTRVQADAARKQDQAETLGRAATITIVAGAVVAACGVAWAVIRAMQSPSAARAAPPRLPTFVRVLAGGSF